MGKKKKRKRQTARAETPALAAPAPAPPHGRRWSWWRVGGLVLGGVVPAVAVGWWLLATGKVPSLWIPGALPRPRGTLAVGGPTLQDFAGAESCRECHSAQYAAWRASTHGRAGGAPSREVVIARFDGVPIKFADAVVTPSVSADGRYQFAVHVTGRRPQVLPVDGVIGGGHMVGGGTQGFVSRFSDGTVRFLPFDFAKREGVWFCNTISRSDSAWMPITPAMSIEECGDWPPVRIVGTDTRYANCQECHAARVGLDFDSHTGRFVTQIPSLAIDCESCHGPLAEHVRRANPARIGKERDLAVEALATRSKDGSLEVCLRCHAVKEVVQPGYLPGKPFQQYYSLGLASLSDDRFFPDGRVRTFAYQENHLFSDCYLNGSMTCVDCHDPHSQGYRDIRGRALDGRFSDEQCTDCHPSKRERPRDHTHHRPGTPGSRCVDCHMPYLQQPEVGHRVRYARSDHTIPIPRPGDDDRMGVVNACALSGCHAGRPGAQLEAEVREWYGTLKPRKRLVAAVLDAAALGDIHAGLALLDTAAAFPQAQVMAVGDFVSRFLSPDMPALDPAADRALRSLSRSPDLDLRATALAALHLARGGDPDVRAFLADALREAGKNDAALRARWAIAMGTFGDDDLKAQRWDQAIRAYQKALEVRPGNAAVMVNLGLAQAYSGDFHGAVATLRQAIALDPRLPLAWLNLGFSLDNLGDAAGAEAAYRQAVAANPSEPLAHFNLGAMLLRQGQLQPAIDQFEQTVELQPTLLQAYDHLVQAYVAGGNGPGALSAARRWKRWAPDDPRAGQLLAEIERALRSP